MAHGSNRVVLKVIEQMGIYLSILQHNQWDCIFFILLSAHHHLLKNICLGQQQATYTRVIHKTIMKLKTFYHLLTPQTLFYSLEVYGVRLATVSYTVFPIYQLS